MGLRALLCTIMAGGGALGIMCGVEGIMCDSGLVESTIYDNVGGGHCV